MPVIHVRALPQKEGIDPTRALQALCPEVARTLGLRERQVFGTWETIHPSRYAEGDVLAERQPDATHPPIVELVAFEGRAPELIESAILAIARVLSRELQIEAGNLFITYREARSGQIFTGGQIKRRAPASS